MHRNGGNWFTLFCVVCTSTNLAYDVAVLVLWQCLWTYFQLHSLSVCCCVFVWPPCCLQTFKYMHQIVASYRFLVLQTFLSKNHERSLQEHEHWIDINNTNRWLAALSSSAYCAMLKLLKVFFCWFFYEVWLRIGAGYVARGWPLWSDNHCTVVVYVDLSGSVAPDGLTNGLSALACELMYVLDCDLCVVSLWAIELGTVAIEVFYTFIESWLYI